LAIAVLFAGCNSAQRPEPSSAVSIAPVQQDRSWPVLLGVVADDPKQSIALIAVGAARRSIIKGYDIEGQRVKEISARGVAFQNGGWLRVYYRHQGIQNARIAGAWKCSGSAPDSLSYFYRLSPDGTGNFIIPNIPDGRQREINWSITWRYAATSSNRGILDIYSPTGRVPEIAGVRRLIFWPKGSTAFEDVGFRDECRVQALHARS
jgi:hypothetical protein